MDTTSKAEEHEHVTCDAAVEQDEQVAQDSCAFRQGELADEESEAAVGGVSVIYKGPSRGNPSAVYTCRKCGFSTIAPPLIQENCPKCGEPGFNSRAPR